MTTIVNTREVAIQATTPRVTTATGYNSVSLILLTPVSVVAATDAGVVSSFPTGNTAKLYVGSMLMGPSSGVSFGPSSITQNGLTLAVNNTTGAITLSQTSWVATDSETFEITATYNSSIYRAIYTITKARAGTAGSGSNAISAVLTNETTTLPCDSAGTVTNFSGASTTMRVYNGASDDTSNWTFSVTKTNVTCSEATSSNTQTITAISADIGYVDFTATRSSYPTQYKRYIVTKVKSGTPSVAYWLVCSAAAIQKSITNVYNPPNITVSAMVSNGTSAPTAYSGRYKIYENGSSTASYTSSADEASKTYTPTAGTVSSLKVELFLAGGTSTKLDEQTIPMVMDGATGVSGNKTATVSLYQWNSSTPSMPTGSSTFTWSTLASTGYAGANGWLEIASLGANPGTAGVKLWQAIKTVGDTAAATTTTLDWSTGVTRSAVTQNGANGADGAAGIKTAIATVYAWDANGASPPSISGSSTYTWATGTLNTAPSGWTLTPAASPSPGFTLWGAAVTMVEAGATTTTTVNWSSSSITARGYSGTNGATGAAGVAARIAYAKISVGSSFNSTPNPYTQSPTTSTSVPVTGTWGLSEVWSTTTPSLSTNEALYQVDGLFNPVTGVTVWSLPYLSSLRVGNLSAIAVNTGSLTVTGAIVVGSSGLIQSANNSGYGTAGFFLGFSGGTYKFSVGSLTYDGTTLTVPAAAVSGTLSSTNFAANSITVDKLTITGKGSALNADPSMKDSSAWITIDGTSPTYTTITDGPSGINVARFNGMGAIRTANSFPVSAGRTYRVSCYARKTSGSGNFYMRMHLYNGAGADLGIYQITSTTSGYTNFEGISIPSTWTRFVGKMTIPSGAVQAHLVVYTNYNTSGVSDVQDFRADESIDTSLIVDSGIQAVSIDTRGLTIKDGSGSIIFGAGIPLSYSNITADPGWQNSNVTLGTLGYTGTANGSADITLNARGPGTSVQGNRAVRTFGGGSDNADVYSLESYIGGAAMGLMPEQSNQTFSFGLSTSPTASTSPSNINYGFYIFYDTTVFIFESGVNRGFVGNYSANDYFSILYDGSEVKYLINGTVYRTVAAAPGQRLYLDCKMGGDGALKGLRLQAYGSPSAISPTNPITGSNSTTFILSAAIKSAQVEDMKTTNYAESGGAATAGVKISSTGTALKAAYSGVQIGTVYLTDYWFRLLNGIDGAYGTNIVWRGNNDTTTNGGAPNIDCLSIRDCGTAQATVGDWIWHGEYTLQPTQLEDNLDSMRYMIMQFYSLSGVYQFTRYVNVNSRVYAHSTHSNSINSVTGGFSIRKRTSNMDGVLYYGAFPYNFAGNILINLVNVYGFSAQRWFRGLSNSSPEPLLTRTTTPPGSAPSTGGSSGGGGTGGYCPAPWVKIALVNGTKVPASSLYNGCKILSVSESSLEESKNGGIIKDLATIWKERIKLVLKDGRTTEWSIDHKFYVINKGWTRIQHLVYGDIIAGPVESVVDYIISTGEGPVVNFTVQNGSTYFGDDLLCHNRKYDLP